MNVLISPTAFKGSLSPWDAARVIAGVLKKNKPNWTFTLLPLADGGDGTLDIFLDSVHGRRMATRVHGPLGKRVKASWAICGDGPQKTAVIEMAKASGLTLLNGKNKILQATTAGTGELIKAGLDHGCRSIIIGVGGTATADGGAGALHALGLRYLDKNNNALSPAPADLIHLHRIDWNGFDSRLKKTRLTIVCDVTNLLLGPHGSAKTFGPQKGASPWQVLFLEKMLRHFSSFAAIQTKNKKGAGAAGALAFGLSAFAGAALVKGAPFIMNKLAWGKAARRADIIITGEGRLDRTSFSGKVIGEICRQRGRAKVYAVCGSSALKRLYLRRKGLSGVTVLGPKGLTRPVQQLQEAVRQLLCEHFS